jgi:hypothetical protein
LRAGFALRGAALGGALFACGCPSRPSLTLDARAATAWGEEDDASAAQVEDARDGDASDGALVYQGPPVLRINGRPAGFIRFVHIAPGAGRVRFIGRNADNYERASVEAEVNEGETSGYLPTVNVPHRVRVMPVGADPDAGVSVELAAIVQSDVYNNAGCTVVFGGRAPWRPRARTQDPEVRRLVRVVDIPRRDSSGIGMLRFMAGVAGAWPATFVERDAPVYERLPFLVITGMRRMPAGAHEFKIASRDGAQVSDPLRIDLPGGETHTLWVFGDHRRAGERGLRYLLTNDVPPGRIGPDFTGEMPVYR